MAPPVPSPLPPEQAERNLFSDLLEFVQRYDKELFCHCGRAWRHLKPRGGAIGGRVCLLRQAFTVTTCRRTSLFVSGFRSKRFLATAPTKKPLQNGKMQDEKIDGRLCSMRRRAIQKSFDFLQFRFVEITLGLFRHPNTHG